MRNLQAQTIFFFQVQAHKQFVFQATVFANNFFSLRNAMLYYKEFYVTTLVLPLTCSLHNNIDGPVFTLPYFCAVVPELFYCLRISAFSLSSTCLLASLITSSLKALNPLR